MKKYLSIFVIAAFLIMSVVTAYNIKVSNYSGRQKAVGKTTEMSQDTIGSVQGTTEEDKNIDTESTTSSSRLETFGTTEEKKRREEKTEEESVKETTTGEKQETMKEDLNFHYDGDKTLEWPVQGNIILPYSMNRTVYYKTLDQYSCNEGLLIASDQGTDVKAATDGRIVNIMDSDRYGKMVTLLIGDYYEIEYGQLTSIPYEIGDEVKKGDILGKVAKPTRSFGKEGPHVFLKITWKGEPVNPADYLS